MELNYLVSPYHTVHMYIPGVDAVMPYLLSVVASSRRIFQAPDPARSPGGS